MENYTWQEQSFEKWDKNGRKGIIKAVPGAGKTRAAINIIEKVTEENPDASIIVVCPTNALIKQWKSQVKSYYNVRVMSYFKAIKLYTVNIDLVILDECHSILSKVRGKVLNINYKWILGLSATPENSEESLGGVVLEVGWENAKVAEFEVEYKKFSMTSEQKVKYHQLSRSVIYAGKTLEKGEISPELYMIIVMKRRSFVYNLPQRAEIALELIEKYKDERIMLFCERLSQIDAIADALRSKSMKFSIYTSKKDTIKRYLNHDTNVLISSKMIKEGFNDPSTSMGIIVSTPLSQRNHIQTIGRIVRYQPGKKAKIITLLADLTTDVTLVPDPEEETT